MPYNRVYVHPEVLANFTYNKICYTIFRSYKNLDWGDPLSNWVNVTLKHADVMTHELEQLDVDMRDVSHNFVPTPKWYEDIQQMIDEGKIDMKILLAHVGEQQ